ncbi:MAG: alpha/beta hydrolase [Proteobacteria bacterium]|nr:alpha/beta hydrolase [Pseudomonadota bacterium]
MSLRIALAAAVLGMTQQAESATAPWPNNIDPTTDTHTFLLWENGAPGALGTTEEDKPTLTLFPVRPGPAGPAPTTAVIIAPGGSYGRLAANHEGRQVANWFNSLGVTAFVLRYRLGPRYHHPIEMGDAQRAIRFVRAHAQELGVRTDRLGFMGFSAGGHLASTVATHFDAGHPSAPDPIERMGSRPDFVVLAYPVISMTAAYGHKQSATNLLGEHPDAKVAGQMSSELQVTHDTPPTFLFSTSSDTTVPAENSVELYLALRKAGVPAELHVFEPGAHGVGLALGDPALGEWPVLLRNWLRGRGLVGE